MELKPHEDWLEEALQVEVGFIEGTVLDEFKHPLEGVRITTNDAATYTDEHGKYVIGDRVCLNPHQLMAYREGCKVTTEAVNVSAKAPQQKDLTLSLIVGTVHGTVRDPDGAALAGATVWLASPDNPTVTTPAGGTYALADQCGTYAIRATHGTPPYYYIGTATIPGTKNFRMKKGSMPS